MRIKKRLKGAEAPAVRLKNREGEIIVGMMAVNNQLLISASALGETLSLIEETVNDLPRLEAYVISSFSMDEIEAFKKLHAFEKVEFISDQEKLFAKKYGAIDENENVTNAFFLIDREGVIQASEYFEEKIDPAKVVNPTVLLAHEKKKGHSHENWMSV